MRILKILLLGAGLYVLVQMVLSTGPKAVAAHLIPLGWKVLPLFLIYPFAYYFNTIGWMRSFPCPLPGRLPFWEIFRIRLIGENLNVVTPWAASVGGEPVKAHLLHERLGVPLGEGYASILIVHISYFTSLNAFIIGAVALTYRELSMPALFWRCLLVFLIALGAVTLGLLRALKAGLFDKSARVYFSDHARRFLEGALFNFFAWCVGIAEIWWLAYALGVNLSFTEAWLLEALIQTVRIATFFIPSSLGAQELGFVGILGIFSVGAPAAMAFAVLRRVREIFWVAVGLAVWALLGKVPPVHDPA